MIWRFTIDAGTPTVIDEPIGWDSITWTARRNLAHHGVFFNINTGELSYIGNAFTILFDEYESHGADGVATLKIEYQCTTQDEYQLFFNGKFDFNTYKRICSDECSIQCQVIANSCVDKFLSRVDTDIDLSTTVDLDGNTITALREQLMVIDGQDIVLKDAANNFDGEPFSDTLSVSIAGFHHCYASVLLPNTTDESLGTFNTNGTATTLIMDGNGATPLAPNGTPIPLAQWEDFMQFTSILEPTDLGISCSGAYNYDYSYDGELEILAEFNGTIDCSLLVKIFNLDTLTFSLLHSHVICTNEAFSSNIPAVIANSLVSNSGSVALNTNEVLCYYFVFRVDQTTGAGSPLNFTITNNYAASTDNYFKVNQISACEPTNTACYNVNDVFNFIPKVLTNDCFESVSIDSCINLYSIANGLQIRNVTNPTPKVFTNWSDYFKNIQKIFNLGWGFTANETQLLISDIRNFYSETLITDVGSVMAIEFLNSQELNFSLVDIGYSTWEAEEYSGLDEMNTERQYRRNVSSFNRPIDLISNFIAAGYTIEITRRKNQALTGTSDWRFDNNIFIINTVDADNVTRAYRGVDYDPSNISSPGTRMNYILTPARNLMRWFKSLCMNPTYTNDIFSFNSGNGNYIAHGKMEQACSLEDTPISENENIISSYFISQDDAKPIWKPMYLSFECPLSIAQQQAIQANPYGIIKVNCNGTDYFGSIISCDYAPNDGLGKFKLLQKIIYG